MLATTLLLVSMFWESLQGRIQDLVRGGAKLTQWPFFADTYVWLETTSQIFHNASNFSCYSDSGPSSNLFVTTGASMRPSSTVAVSRKLSKLTEEHDLPVPANFGQGCYKPGGGVLQHP